MALQGSWLLVIPLSELEWELEWGVEGRSGGLVSGTLAVSILTAAIPWDLHGHLLHFTGSLADLIPHACWKSFLTACSLN